MSDEGRPPSLSITLWVLAVLHLSSQDSVVTTKSQVLFIFIPVTSGLLLDWS